MENRIGICVPLCGSVYLTENMRTAVNFETTAQTNSFDGGSQEGWAKICKMQHSKGLPTGNKYATFTGTVGRA
jgi:hypothetical protein